MNSPLNGQEFWDSLSRTAEKVAAWPEWKTGTFKVRKPVPTLPEYTDALKAAVAEVESWPKWKRSAGKAFVQPGSTK